MTTRSTINSFPRPSLYQIQYPNCRMGMFSLRQPFKEMTKPMSTERLPSLTPAVLQANQPSHDQTKLRTSAPPPRQISKRNAQVQCSLLSPNIRHEIGLQVNLDDEPVLIDYSDEDEEEFSSRYVRRQRLPAIKKSQMLYELVEIDSDDDVDERVIYPRALVKKTLLPSNVRMTCDRDEIRRTSH